MENTDKFNQEVSEIEEKLIQKKSDLGKSEKEKVHEILDEKIKKKIPDFESKPPIDIEPKEQTQDITPDVKEDLGDEYKEEIQKLINVTFEKGLSEAIKELQKSGNPALIDSFHRILTNKVYDKLIERGIIKEL